VFLAAVVVGAIGAAVVLSRKDDTGSTKALATQSTVAVTTTRSAPTTKPAPTTSAVDQGEAFVRQLDVILVNSAESRGKLSDALTALSTCSDPAPVEAQISAIADDRKDEIDQVSQLDPSAADATAMKSTLLDALTNSRASDLTYANLVSAMDRCAPLGASASAAEVTDQAASAAKRKFVAAYNPVAAGYGLRSDWTEDQI
jgi:hypothetical protein